MIYFCADDYGLCDKSSKRILECMQNGVLNKISVFANFDAVNLQDLITDKHVSISLHLNLVEGKCMANAQDISLIADEQGNFKHAFGGLFKLWLLKGKQLEAQAYKEIKAQILHWKNSLPNGTPFCIDSHQHTYMIPSIFRALVSVLRDEQIDVAYMRIPSEPLSPYIKTPSLYCTYSPINIVKQWLLNFLWLVNKGTLKHYPVPTAYFMGILFSGHMDETRVKKILPAYIKLANKHGRNIEVLFHPGYLEENEVDFSSKNIAFQEFYLSKNRKIEFNSVLKLLERSVP